MKFKCPGSCNNSTPQLVIKTCPECGNEIEMFSIDMKAVCDRCGFEAFNDIQSCIEWCQHAEECIGAELYRKLVTDRIIAKSQQIE